jgi:hypothetical protein
LSKHGSHFVQLSMYSRPHQDMVTSSLLCCDSYLKIERSFHFGISFAFHIAVPILASKITC